MNLQERVLSINGALPPTPLVARGGGGGGGGVILQHLPDAVTKQYDYSTRLYKLVGPSRITHG